MSRHRYFTMHLLDMGRAVQAKFGYQVDPVFGDTIYPYEQIQHVKVRFGPRVGGKDVRKGEEVREGFVANRTIGALGFVGGGADAGLGSSPFILGNPADAVGVLPDGAVLYVTKRGDKREQVQPYTKLAGKWGKGVCRAPAYCKLSDAQLAAQLRKAPVVGYLVVSTEDPGW